MVTLLASWRWLRLPAYTAGYPGAMLQAMTYANASRGRTCNTCLQPHVERQDTAGYHTSQAKESCGTAWSIRRSGPCSPLHAPYRRDVHWWESRTTYVPLPTALAGNTNEKVFTFTPSAAPLSRVLCGLLRLCPLCGAAPRKLLTSGKTNYYKFY